jgi:hypothetical protein
MKNKLDKNSKLPSAKSKEASAADAKPKGKAAKPAAKPAPPSKAKNAKAIAESAAMKDAEAKASKAEESARTVKAAKSPSQANRESHAPISKRPAAGKGLTRPRSRAGANETAEELGLEEFAISVIKPGETKERIWRTKQFHQHPAQREFGFPDVAPELPSLYHESKLVLMPKDPEYMFCYWELTQGLIDEKEREKLPSGNYRETLKINWESKDLFEPNFTFIPIFFWARKWYFGVPQVGQRYQVELGWLSDSGHFISIIRSNTSELPESWASTQKRLAEKGDILAYSSRHTKVLGSSEHLVVEDVRAFIPEWNLSSESMSSSSWSKNASAQQQQANAKPAAGTPAKPTKKPVVPKARLEVSGKVLPGVRVFVGGTSVDTDGEGYFKTEFPYGKDTLSLELTSRSGATRSFSYDLKELVLN